MPLEKFLRWHCSGREACPLAKDSSGSVRDWDLFGISVGFDRDFMGFPSDSMGFYSGLVRFYSDSMGFYSGLVGFYSDLTRYIIVTSPFGNLLYSC